MKITEIITTIGIILALSISLFNTYTAYFVAETPDLSFQSFPTELNSLETNEDIEFTFFLYNEGTKPAFVDYIWLDDLDSVITPQKDIMIKPQESQSITITLNTPNMEFVNDFTTHIYYGNNKLSSEKVMVNWG